MLQSQRIHQVLYFTKDHDRRRHYVHVLQGICGVSYVCAWMNEGFSFAPVYWNSDDDDGFGSNNRIAYAFAQLLLQFVLFINYYLCGVWVWKMYVMYDTYMKDIYPLISLENYATFSTRFFEYYEKMEIHSRYWRTNHAVRTATGLYIVMASIYYTY